MTSAVSAAQEVARLRTELAVAQAELTGAKLLIEQLKAQLAVLRRMSFGRSSEKLTLQITQLELLLEDLEEGEAERVAPVTVSASGERERRHPVRRRCRHACRARTSCIIRATPARAAAAPACRSLARTSPRCSNASRRS